MAETQKNTSTASSSRPPLVPSNIATEPGKLSLLASIPNELHLEVLSYLSIEDVMRLRKTCRQYYYYFTRENIQKHFSKKGRLSPELLTYCAECFRVFDEPLILDDERAPDQWRSMCCDCFRVKRSPVYHTDRNKPTVVSLTNGMRVEVCLWCGWPDVPGRWHLPCYDEFCNATGHISHELIYCVFSTYFITPTLVSWCLPDWRLEAYLNCAVVAVIWDFFLANMYIYYVDWQSRNDLDFYRYPHFLMGPISTLIWTPAVLQGISQMLAEQGLWTGIMPSTVFSLYFGLRLLMHGFNTFCILVWATGYDPRSFSLPGLSTPRRLWYKTCSWLVHWWTVPGLNRRGI
ncbi:uncharacterized protein F4812DRAFT_458273 [Daldinia caldariorum]|uniref:uncharacterized protein n=1 Tax=Daldinia caldariorum TaxID=326644 RepID=UPI0020085AFB|nr:uncharacterized protein F4812DRAFT_458273 [Daldinia caldariorum]KAI1468745.1 hypothetical protein F4812DRAFT_458273 [Daldinia caldariorum]